MVVSYWCITNLAHGCWVSIQSTVSIVWGTNWSLSGLFRWRSVVLLPDCRHPRFRNLNSTVPVDVVRVKSYVDTLLNSTRVPVRVSVSKRNFVPERITLVLLACSDTAEVWARESRISLSCSLICSCIQLPVSPIYALPHSQGILYTTPSCFRGSTGSLGRTKCDLSVVSNNINRDSGIEIPKAWMPTIRQHDNRPPPQRTAGDQFLPHTMPTVLWIETHQPWTRFVIHQSLTTTVVQIVRLLKTCIVRSKRRDQYQSVNRETNDKTIPCIHIIDDD